MKLPQPVSYTRYQRHAMFYGHTGERPPLTCPACGMTYVIHDPAPQPRQKWACPQCLTTRHSLPLVPAKGWKPDAFNRLDAHLEPVEGRPASLHLRLTDVRGYDLLAAAIEFFPDDGAVDITIHHVGALLSLHSSSDPEHLPDCTTLRMRLPEYL